jgi:hypothetical protein
MLTPPNRFRPFQTPSQPNRAILVSILSVESLVKASAGYSNGIIRSMILGWTQRSKSTDEWAVTGHTLAFQIKCGKSFFREKDRRGGVYRGENKHFNYFANYLLPVIIVICDPESREAHWVQFRPDDAQVGETGWKVTAPFDNRPSSAKADLEALLPKLETAC